MPISGCGEASMALETAMATKNSGTPNASTIDSTTSSGARIQRRTANLLGGYDAVL